MPGISTHTELELLVRSGLTPREALAAATSNYSERFGWRELGLVEAGRRADLLILAADPTVDNLEYAQDPICDSGRCRSRPGPIAQQTQIMHVEPEPPDVWRSVCCRAYSSVWCAIRTRSKPSAERLVGNSEMQSFYCWRNIAITFVIRGASCFPIGSDMAC